MSQVQKNAPQEQDEPEEVEAAQHDISEITDAVDDLLDEIDGVLEEDAEAMIREYVQKGGE